MAGWSRSVYHPWERWLMSHSRCKAVFPRDHLTAQRLQKWSIPTFDLGNPMMDMQPPAGLFHSQAGETQPMLTVVLLPGSRPPEVYENWRLIAQSFPKLVEAFAPILFLGAIAPGLQLEPLSQVLQAQGWCLLPNEASKIINDPTALTFHQGRATLILTQHAFSDCLDQGNLAIAMAGTATEQFVGLGKPVITLPGHGPQFTLAFANAQSRLLGLSVTLVDEPTQVSESVKALLNDPQRLCLIAENGRRRMGSSGAASRIAACLMETLIR
ncbi:MAG TPA: lipid-A-disaccharide synthase-related protein [Candidatus Caenarcaniphilales bacterium]